MKKAVILILFISFFINDSNSQKIYGFADNYFGSFDLLEKTADTLITFTGNPWINLGFRSAIDRFNGRYFFGGSIPGHSGSFHIITLGENSIESYYSYPQNIEYDFIRNRLIYEDVGELYSLDLNTMQVSFLGEIENGNSTVYGQKRTYIAQTNQYFYIDYIYGSFGDPYFLLIDGYTAEIDCQVMVEEYSYYHYSPSGFVSNNYSGEIIGHRNGRYGIVSPCEGTTTKLTTVPDYYSHLNNQMAVFNHQDSTYVIPYYSTNSNDQYKYAIVDVYGDQILETFSQPWLGEMDLQQIYDKPIAPLIYFQDTLFVPNGYNYKWYRNDSLIGVTNENYWIPQLSGFYRAEVEFREYTTLSTELYISIASSSCIEFDHRISFYPNPVKDYCYIKSESTNIVNIQLCDLSGKLIFENSFKGSTTYRLDITNTPKGVYCLYIRTDNKFITQKLIKQ